MQFLWLIASGFAVVLAGASELLKEFAVGNRQFTADVYKELVKTKTGNLLVCPVSAEIILSLMHTGAGGQTAKELTGGLHLPESKEKIQEIVQALTPLLKGNGNYTLSSANKVYLKNGVKIKDQFNNVAVNVFNSEIQNVDFSKNEQTASEINQWVEGKTENKIKNLVSPDALDKNTRAVLVNAMYFHGTWAKDFSPKNTIEKTFYRTNKDHVKIDMMEEISGFHYSENDQLKAKFLELPYMGNDVTMTIVLPNDKEGLSALESRIDDVLVAPPYRHSDVHVVLPKFTFETEIDFNNILNALGIKDAFTDKADFSGILESEPIKIDKVLQKTFIEVDEKGTKAAAATTVVTAAVLSHVVTLPQPEFIADHPFIFYIKIKDVILFAGRYTSN